MARRWGQRPRMTVSAALAAAAALVAAAVTAARRCPARRPAGYRHHATLYSGQHPQTTDNLVAAFEKKTGIKVNVRSDDEDVLADQIVTEGSRLPGRRLLHRELPAAGEPAGQGPAVGGATGSTLALTPAKYNSPQGDWVGVSARVSVHHLQPQPDQPGQLPTSSCSSPSPKYKGKLALAAGETDFQPIVTSVPARARDRRHSEVAEQDQGERGRAHLPRQRDHRRAT